MSLSEKEAAWWNVSQLSWGVLSIQQLGKQEHKLKLDLHFFI